MSATAVSISIYLSLPINVVIDADPQIVMTTFLLTTVILFILHSVHYLHKNEHICI